MKAEWIEKLTPLEAKHYAELGTRIVAKARELSDLRHQKTLLYYRARSRSLDKVYRPRRGSAVIPQCKCGTPSPWSGTCESCAALAASTLPGGAEIEAERPEPTRRGDGPHFPSSPQNFQDHEQRAARVAVCDIYRGQNSEIEPDEVPRERGRGSPDQEGSGSGEIRGRDALLSGGLQRSQCVVRAEDGDGVENLGRGKSPAHPSREAIIPANPPSAGGGET